MIMWTVNEHSVLGHSGIGDRGYQDRLLNKRKGMKLARFSQNSMEQSSGGAFGVNSRGKTQSQKTNVKQVITPTITPITILAVDDSSRYASTLHLVEVLSGNQSSGSHPPSRGPLADASKQWRPVRQNPQLKPLS
jgi:hypothetical protein